MTQRILPNIVSGGMCCYSQFAMTPFLSLHSKPIYHLINQTVKQLKIRNYADIDQQNPQ